MSDIAAAKEKLQDVLNEEQESESKFSNKLEEDYFTKYRNLARAAIKDIDPEKKEDRDLFSTAKDVHDLCDEIDKTRWTKIRKICVDLLHADSTDVPDNLLKNEHDFIIDTLRTVRK